MNPLENALISYTPDQMLLMLSFVGLTCATVFQPKPYLLIPAVLSGFVILSGLV